MKDEEKISRKLLATMTKDDNDNSTKIPVILTLDYEKNMKKLIDKMSRLGISVDLSLPEPIPIVTCSVSASEIQTLADLPEIKKIEDDGKTYAL